MLESRDLLRRTVASEGDSRVCRSLSHRERNHQGLSNRLIEPDNRRGSILRGHRMCSAAWRVAAFLPPHRCLTSFTRRRSTSTIVRPRIWTARAYMKALAPDRTGRSSSTPCGSARADIALTRQYLRRAGLDVLCHTLQSGVADLLRAGPVVAVALNPRGSRGAASHSSGMRPSGRRRAHRRSG